MNKSIISDKFIKKNMRLAKQIAKDNNSCPSRQVGCVITDTDNIVLGIGYNGPPRGTPHCDSYNYIKDILWPKLDDNEQEVLWKKSGSFAKDAELIASKLDSCKTCPRRFFNYGPGVRNDLCSCQHAETNAITNANGSVKGGILFGWCITSCQGCTGAIINARIKEVHFLAGPEYSIGALKLYEYAGIPVFLHTEEEILNG